MDIQIGQIFQSNSSDMLNSDYHDCLVIIVLVSESIIFYDYLGKNSKGNSKLLSDFRKIFKKVI
jgi:hypothetical protein